MDDQELPTPIRACFERLMANEPDARAELLRLTYGRVLAMTRQMLARYRAVRRWAESDDVLQGVMIRLDRCFSAGLIQSPADFFRLAATQIRREVLDLFRHFYGPQGVGANHATPNEDDLRAEETIWTDRDDPAIVVQAIELHERIDALPPEVRDVALFRWYLGMTLSEVANISGVSPATVKRRLMEARTILGEQLGLDPAINTSGDTFS